jgi:hypothetical protein
MIEIITHQDVKGTDGAQRSQEVKRYGAELGYLFADYLSISIYLIYIRIH